VFNNFYNNLCALVGQIKGPNKIL